MIGSPTTFTTSGRRSNHFRPSSSRNNYVATLQPVIAALRKRQKSVCECCGTIGHKADSCIISGTKFLPPSLRRKINQFNAIHDDKPNKAPREWNSQPPESRFKSSTSLSRTNPAISDIMWKLNHHAIDNGDVKTHTSDFPVESFCESVTYPYTNPIK